jgi:acetylornithine/succinyldiaminopimelate/putrescine aminotransferase
MRRVSAYFFDGLRALKEKHAFITDVRGAGLMIGVELEFPCRHLVQDGTRHGLLFNVTHDRVIRMLPPYIITEKEVDLALRGLGRILASAKPQAA